MKLLLLLLITSRALAFSSAPQQVLDPKKTYKNDIKMSVNGQLGVGVMVVPKAERYIIKGETAGDLDLITITTCHRDISWMPGGKKFEYVLNPSLALEVDTACPMLIGGYDKKGQHSWGVVEFEGSEETLPALVTCNGVTQAFNGVSICQSRQTLTQAIEFKVPVVVSPGPDCPLSKPLGGGKRYDFPIAKGHCVYAFMEQGGEKKIHRLTTIGYESILLREN